ncbi:unnamed protein product [Brassica rapa]|uniref:Uncharacterized protein n=1 Tax=Brassica campestris TaxID=3711 RepID=A0A3P6A1N8_BRACM|nr:unnamed protein product [Brassica rapa]VDC83085.1 unnamed protein product [Brassica rapa]
MILEDQESILILEVGSYLIVLSGFPQPVRISGGTLRASNDFPVGKYIIELNDKSSKLQYIFEYITLRDLLITIYTNIFSLISNSTLLINCNYRGGAIAVINSFRPSIDNCYITRFGNTNGILVQKGHETYLKLVSRSTHSR